MPTINKPKRKQISTISHSDRVKIYSSPRWKRLRALKFADSPLCEKCLSAGVTNPAEDIHHIISFMSTTDPQARQRLAFDYDNLMSLCKICHQSIHNSHSVQAK